MEDDETYCLRLVTAFLKKEGIPFDYNSAMVGGMSLYEHGCRVDVDDTYKLSIQTHSDVVGSSFAETALQNMVTHNICYDGTHGYYDVRRWNTPEELFKHIKAVMAR